MTRQKPEEAFLAKPAAPEQNFLRSAQVHAEFVNLAQVG
jgi:hypothetical protein